MKLLVLLSACNGERFLREQLDSLLDQTLGGVEILVRDDGSSDGTAAILAQYAQRGALRWYGGENLGAAQSFWRLLNDSGDADYYAFCDQDDVWDGDKLEAAVARLAGLPGDRPALYCGDVRVADAAGNVLSAHMVRPCPADYAHALLRNLAPGCTFVFNRRARELFCRYDARRLGMELHDWTAYQLAACFGSVVYDAQAHMRYRQHGANAIGARRATVGAYLHKVRSFLNGPMKNSRSRQARRLEAAFGPEMSAEDRRRTALLAHYGEDRRTKKALLRMLGGGAYGADGRLARLLALIDRL